MIRIFFRGVENIVSQLGKWFSVSGSIGLIAMMLLITIDVFGRFLFSKPVVGSYEIVEFLMIVVIFLGIPYGQVRKQHVNVELFAQILKGRARAVLDSITYFLSFAIFLMITYASVKQTLNIWEAKQSSLVLLIPQWPIMAVMALGVALFTSVLFLDMLRNLLKAIRKL